jgi:hypothetical protein
MLLFIAGILLFQSIVYSYPVWSAPVTVTEIGLNPEYNATQADIWVLCSNSKTYHYIYSKPADNSMPGVAKAFLETLLSAQNAKKHVNILFETVLQVPTGSTSGMEYETNGYIRVTD